MATWLYNNTLGLQLIDKTIPINNSLDLAPTVIFQGSNQNIGIRTDTPTVALEVNGDIKGKNATLAGTLNVLGSNGQVVITNNNVPQRPGVVLLQNGNSGVFQYTESNMVLQNWNGPISFYCGHSNPMTISPNNVSTNLINTGSLVVGTTGAFLNDTRLYYNSVLELGYGIAKEGNAGKMYYGADNILSIVGGGTTVRSIKLFDNVEVVGTTTTYRATVNEICSASRVNFPNTNVGSTQNTIYYDSSVNKLIVLGAYNSATGKCYVDIRNVLNATEATIGTFTCTNGYATSGFTVYGSFSAASKAFKIPHPLNSNASLLHSSIEGPRCDLIYRGRTTLQNGVAYVNVCTECSTNGGMMAGTFNALTRNHDVFLQNASGFSRVRGSMCNEVLNIECEDPSITDEVSWMVVCERKDASILGSDATDADGYLILEPK